MIYLLDTNVLSELLRPRPDARVVVWTQEQSTLDLAISVLTLGEIAKGISLLHAGSRRDLLQRWASSDLPQRFRGRLLPITDAIALAWGRLSAEGQATGRQLPVIDGLLLATAREYGLVFVTRNVSDGADRGIPVYDPWNDRLHS